MEVDSDNAKHKFIKAFRLNYDSNIVEYMNEKGQKGTCKINELCSRDASLPKEGYSDMVDMNILNDAELLNNVHLRYAQDNIFTYVGPTLLVVNPFK